MDPVEEILALQETALNCFYSGEVMSMRGPQQIVDLLKQKGHPELIIADSEFVSDPDSQLFNSLKKNKVLAPIIATAGVPGIEAALRSSPSITAVISKPISAAHFSDVIKSITSGPLLTPEFVPVKTSLLLKLGAGLFDLYLKLSDKNFVKILHRGEAFFDSDEKKLADKGIFELFIKVEDSSAFLTYLEKELTVITVNSSENINLAIDNLEAFEKIAKCLKWTPEIVSQAQRTVEQAVKIISKNEKVVSLIRKKLSKKGSDYSHHVGLLSYLVCAFSSSLGWIGESAQTKLALAALMHDLSVDDSCYNDIAAWNKRAKDAGDKSPETIKYRMHPFEASKLIQSFETIPQDIDQIILQHHEAKDGSGFPRGLDHGRIGQLPALFIMTETLVDFIGNGDNLETSVTDFIMWGESHYDGGHFKKIFQAFKEHLKD